MGSLAAGSAAAMGTGAVSQVTADRDVNLRIAEDSNAYLGFSPGSNANDFVNEASDGTLTVDFTDGVDGANGDGINNRADTTLEGAFKITNNSDRTLYVWAGFADPSDGSAVDPTSGGARSVELRTGSGDKDITYPGAEDKSSEPATSRVLGQTTDTGAIEIGSGDTVTVDIRLLVYGSSDPRDSDFLTVFRASEDDPSPTEVTDHEFDVNV